jgi:hypothetical protein
MGIAVTTKYWLGSSVGTSARLKIVRSTVRSCPEPHYALLMKTRSELQMLADDKADPYFQMMESGMTIEEICKKMSFEPFTNKIEN